MLGTKISTYLSTFLSIGFQSTREWTLPAAGKAVSRLVVTPRDFTDLRSFSSSSPPLEYRLSIVGGYPKWNRSVSAGMREASADVYCWEAPFRKNEILSIPAGVIAIPMLVGKEGYTFMSGSAPDSEISVFKTLPGKSSPVFPHSVTGTPSFFKAMPVLPTQPPG